MTPHLPHAPAATTESDRLARLHALLVLDTAPEPFFDALARLAARDCATPIALVSLVDAGRQWFKACVGLPGVEETPREVAFCAHAIEQDGVMEVADAQVDPRFCDNPLVTGPPGIRFYAGAPLVLPDGARLGTLCVIDTQPRVLNEAQRGQLRDLAALAVQALLMRQSLLHDALTARSSFEHELAAREVGLRTLYEATPAMLHSVDMTGRMLMVSDRWLTRLGYRREDVIGRRLSDFAPPHIRRHVRDVVFPALMRTGRCDHIEGQMLDADGGLVDVRVSTMVEHGSDGQPLRTLSVVEDLTTQHAVEAALRSNQERLAVATQANGIGIWELDVASGRLSWNAQMFELFGVAADAFGGLLTDWLSRVHPEDRAFAQRELDDALAGRRQLDFDFRVCLPAGAVRSVMARATVFRDARGEPVRVVGMNHDITDRKVMERELAEKHELLRVTLHSIGDAVITADAQGRVQWLNPVAERMTGWRTEAARGLPLEQVFCIVDEHTREPAPSPVTRCLQDTVHAGEAVHTLLVSRTGETFGIEDSAAPIRDEDGHILGVVLVFHDVTEQRRMGHEMRYRASHDPLTGLVNRAEFERQLATALAAAQQHDSVHALMYIDLDQFKLVNDACGHAVGDQLLCKVTQLLQGCVRNSDTLARLGGDEFGVILTRCNVEQAQRVAQTICDEMEDFRFVHDGRRFRVGTSIGLVPVDRRWASTAAVMQAADASCYAAKEAGRNRVHAWYDTDEAVQTRKGEMQWASRLEQALDENRFVLFGQRIAPIRRRAAGLHCEVLLRLLEPDGSLTPPGAFLPAAERFHMATRIDRWVVRTVFALLSTHADALAHVDMLAVNLSGQSIGDPAFQRFVTELIRDSDADVRKLCFEVTETAAITKLTEAAAFIEQMRAQGIRIALDDFGAGASSFGYLKRLPVDYLKIDGQFIRDLVNDPLDQAAVRCFTDVARVLGLQTIAEFVEDAATLSALRALGVDHAQGYLVHKPEALDKVLWASPALAEPGP